MLLLWISGLGFGTWFALSVVKQFQPIDARAFWIENFTFIPRWWFFRYNFEEGEFRISIRGVEPGDDGPAAELPDWEVVDLPRAPLWRAWIWNPEMRVNKELWDACARLCALSEWLRFSKNFTPSTAAYRVLVAWVSAAPGVVARPGRAIRIRVDRVPLTPAAGEPVCWFVSRPFVPRALTPSVGPATADARPRVVPVG